MGTSQSGESNAATKLQKRSVGQSVVRTPTRIMVRVVGGINGGMGEGRGERGRAIMAIARAMRMITTSTSSIRLEHRHRWAIVSRGCIWRIHPRFFLRNSCSRCLCWLACLFLFPRRLTPISPYYILAIFTNGKTTFMG